MTRVGYYCIRADAGETGVPREKPTMAALEIRSLFYETQANFNKSSASDLQNPGMTRFSNLNPISSFIRGSLHFSELGTGKYFILVFTSVYNLVITGSSLGISLFFFPKKTIKNIYKLKI